MDTKRVGVVVLVLLLLTASVTVQADVSTNHAHLRIVQLADDVRAISVTFEAGQTVIANLTPGIASDYLTYEINRSTWLQLGVTPISGTSFVLRKSVPPLAGGYYSAVIVGSALDQSLDLLVVDEDSACEARLAQGACLIVVNNIKGSPPLTLVTNNRPVVENAAYSQAVIGWIRAGTYQDFRVATGDNLATTVLQLPARFFEPNVIYFYGLTGNYPGAPGLDYSLGSTRRVPVDMVTFLRGLTAERQLTDGNRLFATENMVWVLEESRLALLLSSPLANLTVFAPMDAAGFEIPEEVLKCAFQNPASIRDIVFNHILPGRLSPEQLLAAGSVTTMAGTTLTFTPTPEQNAFLINHQVRVEYALGYAATNGNLYLTDSVLIPEDFIEQHCSAG